MVFVDLPTVGAAVTVGSSFGSVESVKAASEVYAPVSGEVVEVNSVRKSADTLAKFYQAKLRLHLFIF